MNINTIGICDACGKTAHLHRWFDKKLCATCRQIYANIENSPQLVEQAWHEVRGTHFEDGKSQTLDIRGLCDELGWDVMDRAEIITHIRNVLNALEKYTAGLNPLLGLGVDATTSQRIQAVAQVVAMLEGYEYEDALLEDKVRSGKVQQSLDIQEVDAFPSEYLPPPVQEERHLTDEKLLDIQEVDAFPPEYLPSPLYEVPADDAPQPKYPSPAILKELRELLGCPDDSIVAEVECLLDVNERLQQHLPDAKSGQQQAEQENTSLLNLVCGYLNVPFDMVRGIREYGKRHHE